MKIKLKISKKGNKMTLTAKQAWGQKGRGTRSIPCRAQSNLQTKRWQKSKIQGVADKNHLLKNEVLKGEDFIATRKELSITIDYLSMVFDSITTKELIQRIA